MNEIVLQMVPILWRFILAAYLRILSLTVGSFVAVLLVLRFRDIAKFATFGGGIVKTLYFVALQIPYILPLSIPIAALMATFILFNNLTASNELTAFRASGIGLRDLLFPLMIFSTLLAVINFSLASEITPRCREITGRLIYEMTEKNPLFLFQKDSAVNVRYIFTDIDKFETGKRAENAIFVVKNRGTGSLNVMSAAELSIENGMLKGKNVALLAPLSSKNEHQFDNIYLENYKSMETADETVSFFLRKNNWAGKTIFLPLRHIIAELKNREDYSLNQANKAFMEIFRRISIGLAAATFTFVGVACGISVGRNRSKKGVTWAGAITTFYIACYSAGKALSSHHILLVTTFLLPHLIMWAFSAWKIRKFSRGIE